MGSVLDRRHLAVIGALFAAVAVAGGLRALLPPRSTMPVTPAGVPDCEEGLVVVAWRLDGERVGCREDLESLLELAAGGSSCNRAGAGDEVGLGRGGLPAIAAGDLVQVMRGTGGRCVITVEPLPGARKVALGVPIDVNSASKSDLMAIRGIGPARASAIVEERETGGPFATVEDLARTHGIGPVTVERMAPYVRVQSVDDAP